MNKNLFRHSLIGLLERNLITNKEIDDELYKDYLSIERLWWSNFDNFGSIKLVLIGESPLSSRRYIYNKDNDAKDSAFLLIEDLKECLRKSGKKPIDLKSKGKMEAMLDLGLLVLDMFPFAFNSETKFNYQNIDQEHLKLTKKPVILMPGKEHKELLKDLYFKSYSWHLSSKVKKIMSKVRADTIYAYRYKRSAKLELDVFPKIQPTCLGGKAYGINPEKLYEIFNK